MKTILYMKEMFLSVLAFFIISILVVHFSFEGDKELIVIITTVNTVMILSLLAGAFIMSKKKSIVYK